MRNSPLLHRVLSGEAGGWATPLRGLLWAASLPYGQIVRLRNRHYDRRGPRASFSIPIISVGNLTVGGTGKTPLVIDIVQRLERMGRAPAVVSRGYGAAPGEPNDEELVIRRRCPTAICVARRDRASGVELAIERFGADAIVLDDGFQHRRVDRNLDIVAIDATRPFGYGHILPRGLLREPPSGLRRAHLLVVTRCDQTSREDLDRLLDRLTRYAPDRPLIKCRHVVTRIETLDGQSASEPWERRRAVLFAGIGHPEAFERTARALGVEIVGRVWFPDHHSYRRGDLAAVQRRAHGNSCDMLLTTEKDAAKLARLPGLSTECVRVLGVAIDFIDDGGTILQAAIEKTLRRQDFPSP